MKYVENRLHGKDDEWQRRILCFICGMNDMNSASPDSSLLRELIVLRMPFGKYKGVILCNLPVSYLEWFAKKGFPPGKLGMLLATMYEIKINGLDYLLTPLKGKI